MAIAKEYADEDERIILIDKPNSGYGHSMNVGIDNATGKYLGILESDDYLALNMFEDLYELAVKNDLDVVRGDFYRFTRDSDGSMNLQYVPVLRKSDMYGKLLNPSEDAECALARINTWTGIYRLSFLRRNNIRHHETPGASFQDNGFFWQAVIHAERTMFVNKPYYYCRRDNPNSSVKDPTKVWNMSREYDFIRDVLMENPRVWERFRGYYWLNKFWNYNFIENLISPEFKADFIRRVSKEYKRALYLEEPSKDLFGENDWSKFQSISRDPEGYIKKYYPSAVKGKDSRKSENNTGKQSLCDTINKDRYTQKIKIRNLPRYASRFIKSCKREGFVPTVKYGVEGVVGRIHR